MLAKIWFMFRICWCLLLLYSWCLNHLSFAFVMLLDSSSSGEEEEAEGPIKKKVKALPDFTFFIFCLTLSSLCLPSPQQPRVIPDSPSPPKQPEGWHALFLVCLGFFFPINPDVYYFPRGCPSKEDHSSTKARGPVFNCNTPWRAPSPAGRSPSHSASDHREKGPANLTGGPFFCTFLNILVSPLSRTSIWKIWIPGRFWRLIPTLSHPERERVICGPSSVSTPSRKSSGFVDLLSPFFVFPVLSPCFFKK